MKVIEKNKGKKIPYEIKGAKITFDDDLTINTAKRESDSAVHIDVCFDIDRNLVVGAAVGRRRYVAEIDIPARKYEEVENENYSETENDDEYIMKEPKFKRIPVPFNPDNVIVTLWEV